MTEEGTGDVVAVAGLSKRYGQQVVLDDVDLRLSRGELVVLVGPNGAGKTTTVEVMGGHVRRDEGHVSVLGVDPWRAGSAFRKRIGMMLQFSCIEPNLRVQEIVSHTAALYPQGRSGSDLLERLALAGKQRALVGSLSLGERQRLDLVLALVGSPELLLLDEPTAALDPAGRRVVRDVLDDVRGEGTTVLMTTHAIEEVGRSADRVIVLVGGRVMADGPPADLVGALPAEIRFRVGSSTPPESFLKLLDGESFRLEGDMVVLTSPIPVEALRRLTTWAVRNEIDLRDLRVGAPSLEARYLELVS